MNTPRYDVPDEAPIYVKHWLKYCRSRVQLWTLIVLSVLAALATAYAERGKPAALLGLVFLWFGFWAFLAVRWGETHDFFDQKQIEPPGPRT